MLARDLLQPLAEQTANRSVAEIASWLAEGVPVAFADADGWRYVRPSDAVSAPRTRQLCDVPSVPLPTVDVAAQQLLPGRGQVPAGEQQERGPPRQQGEGEAQDEREQQAA